MLLRLALAMNEPDIDAFSQRVTVRDLVTWWGFWRLEPWGDEWRRTAKAVGRMRRAWGLDDGDDYEQSFMPGYRRRDQTEAEIEAELRKIPAFAAQMDRR